MPITGWWCRMLLWKMGIAPTISANFTGGKFYYRRRKVGGPVGRRWRDVFWDRARSLRHPFILAVPTARVSCYRSGPRLKPGLTIRGVTTASMRRGYTDSPLPRQGYPSRIDQGGGHRAQGVEVPDDVIVHTLAVLHAICVIAGP